MLINELVKKGSICFFKKTDFMEFFFVQIIKVFGKSYFLDFIGKMDVDTICIKFGGRCYCFVYMGTLTYNGFTNITLSTKPQEKTFSVIS